MKLRVIQYEFYYLLAVEILPGMKSPTVMPLANSGWCSVHSVVNQSEIWEKIEKLKMIGAEDILVLSLDKMML
jgi:ATP phosphoribosyltransferase